MPASDDSFVMLGDDSVESVPISGSFDGENLYSGYDGPVAVETSTDDYSHSSIYGDYSNANGIDGADGGSDGPILPPLSEMEPEEGFALREWRRQNAIKLEEKEQREKELLSQIIDEADRFKAEFYKKIEITCENNIVTNGEKEKLFLASQEKFYAEADKNYWKAIAELVPNEVPAVEKRRGKKEQEKKPSLAVIQGPKPGKPTDLTRMRQILLKLKHNPPPASEAAPPKNVPEVTTAKAVVAA